MTPRTPDELRACFAEETGLVLPPGSMTPVTAATAASDFVDAWEADRASLAVANMRLAAAIERQDRIHRVLTLARRLVPTEEWKANMMDERIAQEFPNEEDGLT